MSEQESGLGVPEDESKHRDLEHSRRLLDLDEAATRLGVTPDELVEMRSEGEIHGYRDGASWKFKTDEVERVAAERRIQDSELGLSDDDDLVLSGLDSSDSDLSMAGDALHIQSPSDSGLDDSDINLSDLSDSDSLSLGETGSDEDDVIPPLDDSTPQIHSEPDIRGSLQEGPPWGNRVLSAAQQLEAGRLQYGGVEEPASVADQNAAIAAHIQRTLGDLPEGDADAPILAEAMRNFSQCVLHIRQFADTTERASNFLRSAEQTDQLSQSFEEMVSAIESVIKKYGRHIDPANGSVVDSVTERRIIESRLSWIENTIRTLMSISRAKIPLIKSHAHKAGRFFERQSRQEALRSLLFQTQTLKVELEGRSHGTWKEEKRKQELEKRENSRTTSSRRMFEQVWSVRSALFKTIVGVAAVIGGNWALSPGGDGRDEQNNTAITTQSTDAEGAGKGRDTVTDTPLATYKGGTGNRKEQYDPNEVLKKLLEKQKEPE
jgi:excisionase family DNA binding protein